MQLESAETRLRAMRQHLKEARSVPSLLAPTIQWWGSVKSEFFGNPKGSNLRAKDLDLWKMGAFSTHVFIHARSVSKLLEKNGSKLLEVIVLGHLKL